MDGSTLVKHWIQHATGKIAIAVLLCPASTTGVRQWIASLPTDILNVTYIVASTDLATAVFEKNSETLRGQLTNQARLHLLSTDELSVAQGCFCCSFRSELHAFLGHLFMSLLARREPPVKIVLVLTQAMNAALLEESIQHAPFLDQRYAFQGALSLTS